MGKIKSSTAAAIVMSIVLAQKRTLGSRDPICADFEDLMTLTGRQNESTSTPNIRPKEASIEMFNDLGERTGTQPGIRGSFEVELPGVAGAQCRRQMDAFDDDKQGVRDVVHVRLDSANTTESPTSASSSTLPLVVDGRWTSLDRIGGGDSTLVLNVLFKNKDRTFGRKQTSGSVLAETKPTSDVRKNDGIDASMENSMIDMPMRNKGSSRRLLAIGDAMTADSFYDGCEVKQGCIGCTATGSCTGKSGSGCLATKNCRVIANYKYDAASKRVSFQMLGKQVPDPGWVAIGLSADAQMGEDSVVACSKQGNSVPFAVYWNSGRSRPTIISPAVAGVASTTSGKYENGDLFCSFSRNMKTTVQQTTFDLAAEKYFLLLASGPDAMNMHSVRGSPGSAVNLTMVDGAEESGVDLALVHGILMMIAWVAAACSGMLTARYYKKTWVDSKLCGKAVWFSLHRPLMILTCVLTIIAFIIIVVEEKGIEKDYHPVIGVIILILTFAQPIMATARPDPGSRKRPLFNWAHWAVGNIALLLAAVNIFLAVDFIDDSKSAKTANGLFGAFVAFYCIINLLLEAQKYYQTAKARNATSPLEPEKMAASNDDPGTGIRRILFATAVGGNCVATVVLACAFAGYFASEDEPTLSAA